MKKFLLLILLVIPQGLFAQRFVSQLGMQVQNPNATVPLPVAATGGNTVLVKWTSTGTVSTCTFTVQGDDGSGAFATTVIGATTCTSSGNTAATPTTSAFIRVNVSALSGGGTFAPTMFLYDVTGAAGSTNISQIGGSTISLGQAVMASSLPIVIASNQSPVQSSGAISLVAGVADAACEKTAVLSGVGATTTQIIALSGTTQIHICSLTFSNNSATATVADLVQGTGTNCATGQTVLTGLFSLGANTIFNEVTMTFPKSGLTAVAGNAVCVTGTAAGAISAGITYSQY